jgi:hypothetical protein
MGYPEWYGDARAIAALKLWMFFPMSEKRQL